MLFDKTKLARRVLLAFGGTVTLWSAPASAQDTGDLAPA